MAREITFSILPVGSEEAFRALLDRFEQQTGIHVNILWMDWDQYRLKTVNFSLQRQPVDVSMVGMPVTSDLIGMNVARPFSPQEITTLGGATSFLPARWKSGIRPGSNEVWAVPWGIDVRILVYWRDMLEQVGLNETTALSSHQAIANTLQKLTANGMKTPWRISTSGYGVLHNASSWIWEAGGDLFSPDGRRVIFQEKEAVEGLRAFFSLLPYIDHERLAEYESNQFFNRQEAVMINAPTILHRPEVNDPRLGVAALPGGSYVGGVDLVIWSRSVDEQASLELVRFLTQPSLLSSGDRFSSFLPTRTAQLADPANWPNNPAKAVARATLTGRAYPCAPMVGLVEERLSMTLTLILKDLLANPQADLEQTIRNRIEPLAKRINLSLSQE